MRSQAFAGVVFWGILSDFRLRGASGVRKTDMCINPAHILGLYVDFRFRGASGVANHGIRIDLEKFS